MKMTAMLLGEIIERIWAENPESIIQVVGRDENQYALGKPLDLMETMTDVEQHYICTEPIELISIPDGLSWYITIIL